MNIKLKLREEIVSKKFADVIYPANIDLDGFVDNQNRIFVLHPTVDNTWTRVTEIDIYDYVIKKESEYEIKITGSGTSKDIVSALRLIANAIESKCIRESLDSPEVDDLDGAEWEDCTLMTEINKIG